MKDTSTQLNNEYRRAQKQYKPIHSFITGDSINNINTEAKHEYGAQKHHFNSFNHDF